MEIRHLKLLHTLNEQGTLVKASESLHLTQPALSHQLKSIEQQLGLKILKRNGKKLEFTETGSQLLEYSKKVLNEMENLEINMHALKKGHKGIIRMSTECYTTYKWFPKVVNALQEKFKDIEIQIVLDATKDPIEHLKNSKIDMAIIYCKIDDKNVTYFDLFEDELVAVVSKNHPWVNKKNVNAKDFQSENLIMYDGDFEESLIYQLVLNPTDIVPKKITKVQITEAIIEMVKANMGVAVLARWAILPFLKSKQIKSVEITKNGLKRKWYLAVSKKSMFKDQIAEIVKQLKSLKLEEK